MFYLCTDLRTVFCNLLIITDGPEIKYKLVGPHVSPCALGCNLISQQFFPGSGVRRPVLKEFHFDRATETHAFTLSTPIRCRFAPCFLCRFAPIRADAPFAEGQDNLFFTRLLPLVAHAKLRRQGSFKILKRQSRARRPLSTGPLREGGVF